MKSFIRETTASFAWSCVVGRRRPTRQHSSVTLSTMQRFVHLSCFDPAASRTVMPYYELRSKLGMEGKTPDQIAESVQAAYVTGKLPKREFVSFAYMWSADQSLGPGIGAWHPHMMIFAPYYEN